MGGGGSSGVHAMDGQSGDGAREGETLGKGGSHPESEALGKGGSDAHSVKSDDLSSANSVVGGSLPSNAPTSASGIEGDPALLTLVVTKGQCGMSPSTKSTEIGTTRRLLGGSLGRGASCVAIGVAIGMIQSCTSIWTLI